MAMTDAEKSAMKVKIVAAVILVAAYKFAPNAMLKTAVLGVAGVMAAGYIPFLNGTDPTKAVA